MAEDYDVIIVGSGLIGSAYARILAERAPLLRIVMLEAGPPADERTRGQCHERDRPRRTCPVPARFRRTRRRRRPGPPRRVLATPGHLPDPPSPAPELGDQDDMPDASHSDQRRGHGRALDLRLPVAVRQRAHRLHQGRRVGRPGGRGGAAAARHHRAGSTRRPGSRATLAGLAVAFDEGRPLGRQVQPMPLAVHAAPRRVAALVWHRHRARPAGLGPARQLRAAPGHRSSAGSCTRRPCHRGGDRRPGRHRGRRYPAKVVVVAADALRTPQLLWASGIRPAGARPVPQRPAAGRGGRQRADPRTAGRGAAGAS